MQDVLEKRLESLGPSVSTCSHAFLQVVDELERIAVESLEKKLRWRRVELPPRRGEGEADDLVVAAFLVENLVVEIGIKGFNRCAPVGDLLRALG
jgi:hypothetical protein